MSEEILINVTLMETRVALLENGLLQEIFIERQNRRGYVGDIFRGKVVRVMPGMEAAFVDIGLDQGSRARRQAGLKTGPQRLSGSTTTS